MMDSIHRSQFAISETDHSLIILPDYLLKVTNALEASEFKCIGVSIDNANDIELLVTYKQDVGEYEMHHLFRFNAKCKLHTCLYMLSK